MLTDQSVLYVVKVEAKVCVQTKWPIRLSRAYPGFCSMKGLGVFLLPLDGMLLHRRDTPSMLIV